jgi:hypothetical protein
MCTGTFKESLRARISGYRGDVANQGDELERAARRRRERVAVEKPTPPSLEVLAAELERRQSKVRRYRVDEALAGSGWGKLRSTVAVCLGLFGPMIAVPVLLWDRMSLVLVLILGAVSSGLGGICATRIHTRVFAAIGRRRVYAIGHGFDADAYLDALGDNRRQAVIVVRSTFGRPWTEERRAFARDAVLEWMPKLAWVEWDGDTLVLRSAEVDGTKFVQGGELQDSARFFDNTAIHTCFDAIMRRVIPRLDKASPISKLEVELVGKVLPLGADP